VLELSDYFAILLFD